jgi:hypothetical protein
LADLKAAEQLLQRVLLWVALSPVDHWCLQLPHLLDQQGSLLKDLRHWHQGSGLLLQRCDLLLYVL